MLMGFVWTAVLKGMTGVKGIKISHNEVGATEEASCPFIDPSIYTALVKLYAVYSCSR